MASKSEEAAIAHLNELFSGQVRPDGWRAELFRLSRLCGECDWPDLFPFRPDGFIKLLVDGYVWFIAVEVENTNPLSARKIHAYANLWDEVESSDRHRLGLITTDRYGHPRWIDLAALFYALFDPTMPNRIDGHPESIGWVAEHCKGHRLRRAASREWQSKKFHLAAAAARAEE